MVWRNVALACLLVAAAGPARAQSSSPVIVTQGEAIVRRPADRAWITVATETRHRAADEARAQSAEVMSSAQEAIRNQGIAADAIRTTGFSLTPEMNYDDGRGEIRGYVVRNRIEVRIDDLDRLPDVIGALETARNTGLSIIGPRFGLQDEQAAQSEALRLAVEAARSRAAAIAAGAGGTLGRIVRIEEQSQGGPVPMPEMAMMRAADGAAGPATPISPGEIEVRAVVVLTVDME